MKCPVCGKDLIEIELGECWFLVCCNSKCRCKGVASDTVWEYIDRTRKALDWAKNAILVAKQTTAQGDVWETLEEALNKIKALEQKEHIADVSKKIEQKDVK